MRKGRLSEREVGGACQPATTHAPHSTHPLPLPLPSPPLPPCPQARRFFRQIISAVNFCHKHKVWYVFLSMPFLTLSLPHSLTLSLPHPLTPSPLTPHPLTPSPSHSLTPSLPHPLTPSPLTLSLPHPSPAATGTSNQRISFWTRTRTLKYPLPPSHPHTLTPSHPHTLTASLQVADFGMASLQIGEKVLEISCR